MKLGIVGLPNVGKSTLFNSLTKAGAESANYPFCTIDPNVGIVAVPDERLKLLGDFYQSKKVNHILNKSGKHGIIIGSLFALFPQCGFSVIGASLYAKRLITRGTLIAIFLATSDETIPILLAISLIVISSFCLINSIIFSLVFSP